MGSAFLRRRVRRVRLRLAIAWRRLVLGALLPVVRQEARDRHRKDRPTALGAPGPDANHDRTSPRAMTRREPGVRRTDR